MIHVGVRIGPLINYAAISYKLAQYQAYLFQSFAPFDKCYTRCIHDRRQEDNTRSSATAEKQRVSCPHKGRVGLDPPAPSPPLPLATPMRMAESESHNVRTSSVPSVKCTLR